MHDEHQVPIWFFIGVLLLIYGIIITGTGIFLWIWPPPGNSAWRCSRSMPTSGGAACWW